MTEVIGNSGHLCLIWEIEIDKTKEDETHKSLEGEQLDNDKVGD